MDSDPSETLVGVLTREVAMTPLRTRQGASTMPERVAAGTEVYVSERADGWLDVRVVGTLLVQRVSHATVTCP